MARFVILALPLLLLAMAGHGFLADQLGRAPDTAALAGLGLERSTPPPSTLTLGGWLIEAAALVALFLLVQGRSGRWWLDGLLTGALAWVFRAPLLVATIASLSRLPLAPFTSWARGALALELACGVLLAALARLLKLER